MNEDTISALDARMANMIREHGQALIAVPRNEEGEGFAYTVGNAENGYPELLVVGNYSPRLVGRVLNDLHADMVAGKFDKETEEYQPEGYNFPFRLRCASERAQEEFTCVASRRLGHDHYDVIQVLICDPNGRFPGDLECMSDYVVELV